MKKLYLLLLAILFSTTNYGQTIIISQYVETNSGTTPKGIELWNPTAIDIDFTSSNLVVKQGTNGGALSTKYTLSTGVLKAGEVLVLGTSNMDLPNLTNHCPNTQFYLVPFVFNGDDALQIELGGTVTDVFGTPGTDPGSAWTGGGVSTRNSNISLKADTITGDTDGWSDPSLRFETTGGGQDLTGFGTPPSGCPVTPIYDPTPGTCESVTVNISGGNEYVDVMKNGAIIAQINPNGNNLGNTTVDVYKSSTARKDADSTYYLNRSIFITPTTQPTSAVSVRLFLTKSEYDQLVTDATNGSDPNVPNTINDLNITKVSGLSCGTTGAFGAGTGSEIITPTAVAYGTDYYLDFNVNSFSGFFAHGGPSALPVEWKRVYVETNSKHNVVHWEVANEQDVEQYVLESSTNGRTWSDVGTVAFSADTEHYNYKHHSISPITYYRVKQIDFDGQYMYSKIVSVQRSMKTTSMYPNPVVQGEEVVLDVEPTSQVSLFDALGKQIQVDILINDNRYVIPTANLKQGIYFVQIDDQVQKLIIR